MGLDFGQGSKRGLASTGAQYALPQNIVAKDKKEKITTKRAVGFRGNSQSGDNCQENDFVAIDCGASRVTKKQTVFRDNRLDLVCLLFR